MKSMKIPSTKLYALFERKNNLFNAIKTTTELITNVEHFNIMNEKVNRAIYRNVKNGKFNMCLINDLPYNSITFNNIKQSEHKLINGFFEENCEYNYVNYLKTNWMINELLKENWNVYYDEQEYKSSGGLPIPYNNIYITPHELDKHKVVSQRNIIPYNGFQILDELNNEYKELKVKYEQNDQKIEELC